MGAAGPADEQRRRGVRGEHDALRKRRVGVVGARHPVDETAHHRHTGQHREVGEYRQLHATGLRQLDRLATSDAPAHLGRADVGRHSRDCRKQQHMGQIHVADGLFLATDFVPLLTRVGEQTPNVMDHASVSSAYGGSLRLAVVIEDGACDLMSQYRNAARRCIGPIRAFRSYAVSGNSARVFPWPD